ncbi:MAG: hypothetical protein R6U65_07835 [Perlabentimonas sp.]
MIKSFYFFPFKKDTPYLMYDDRKVFSSEIFISLYNKIYGVNSWKLIMRKFKPISILFEQFSKRSVAVPAEDVNLIYVGYDSSLYFSLDENTQVSKLYRYMNNNFVEEKFLGHTLNIYSSKEFERQMAPLKDFFRSWWIELRDGTHGIHGDLTPFNICIADSKILLIDSKPEQNNSIIFDHLYFYAYSMHLLGRRKFMKKTEKQLIQGMLEELVIASFPESDYDRVIQLAKGLILKGDPPFHNFETFCNRFIAIVDGAK